MTTFYTHSNISSTPRRLASSPWNAPRMYCRFQINLLSTVPLSCLAPSARLRAGYDLLMRWKSTKQSLLRGLWSTRQAQHPGRGQHIIHRWQHALQGSPRPDRINLAQGRPIAGPLIPCKFLHPTDRLCLPVRTLVPHQEHVLDPLCRTLSTRLAGAPPPPFVRNLPMVPQVHPCKQSPPLWIPIVPRDC